MSLAGYAFLFSDVLSCFLNILIIFGRMFHDERGNIPTNDDGEPLIHTDGTGFISFDLAVKCPTSVFKGNFLKAHEVQVCTPPTTLPHPPSLLISS